MKAQQLRPENICEELLTKLKSVTEENAALRQITEQQTSELNEQHEEDMSLQRQWN